MRSYFISLVVIIAVIIGACSATRIKHNLLRLVAVQARWSVDKYKTETDFHNWLRDYVASALKDKEPGITTLFVFPEYIGLPLVFMGESELVQNSTSWSESFDRLCLKHGEEIVALTNPPNSLTPQQALFYIKSDNMLKVYDRTFGELAREFKVYIVAGSIPVYDHKTKSVYNTAFVFNPDGMIIHHQNKVNLVEGEKSEDGLCITSGSEEDIHTFRVGSCICGITICLDAWHTNIINRLSDEKAEIILQPSANPKIWDEIQSKDWENGLWKAVQENENIKYGISAMMVGWLFSENDEFACQGRSAISADIILTTDKSGFARQSPLQEWGHYINEALVIYEY